MKKKIKSDSGEALRFVVAAHFLSRFFALPTVALAKVGATVVDDVKVQRGRAHS